MAPAGNRSCSGISPLQSRGLLRVALATVAVALLLSLSRRADAISGQEAVARAQQWVDAGMPYCQCKNYGSDSHGYCERPSNPDWDQYRSDCSGLVTWAWGLPPVGSGGYVTSNFAPHDNSFSHEIDASTLQPGDAINQWSQHIILFAGWVIPGQRATLIEEYNWGHNAHRVDTDVTISGSSITRHDWGETYTAIRFNDMTWCSAHCEGSVIVGDDCGQGDCGAYGATCAQDQLGVRCVSVFCPPLGDSTLCLPNSNLIGTCHDGGLTTGDCGAYGAFCSTANGAAPHCASSFCVASATQTPAAHEICLPNGQLAHCNGDGVFENAVDCPAGKVCVASSVGAECIGAKAPTGNLEAAGCDGIVGWAQDPDQPGRSIVVHLSFDGQPGEPSVKVAAWNADVSRDDLCTALGSCAHAFTVPAPYSLFDGNQHAVRAYGVDTEGGANAQLGNSPRSLSCRAAKPDGLRRHVVDTKSFVGWNLTDYFDRLPLANRDVSSIEEGSHWPDKPQLVRAEGKPEIWLLDGTQRRHVTSPTSMALWRLRFEDVKVLPASEIDALTPGPDLPSRPMVVRDGNGAAYLIDTRPEAPAASIEGRNPRSQFDGETGGSCRMSGKPGVDNPGAWLVLCVIGLSMLGRRRARIS